MVDDIETKSIENDLNDEGIEINPDDLLDSDEDSDDEDSEDSDDYEDDDDIVMDSYDEEDYF